MKTLPLYIWSPAGRKEHPTSPESYRLEVINHLQCMVRETGYHFSLLVAAHGPHDQAYSRSQDLYTTACNTLRVFSPTAEQFIASTYRPEHGYIDAKGVTQPYS